MKASTRLAIVALIGTALLGAGPVSADVYVYADIFKEKDVTVDVTVDINKEIDLFVYEYIPVDAVAEQLVIKNQRNQFNFVEDENALSAASIESTAGTASGVVLFNQAPGLVNNQGNEVSVTYVESPEGPIDSTSTQSVDSSSSTTDTTTVTDPAGTTTTTQTVSNESSETTTRRTQSTGGGSFVHAEASVEQVNGANPPPRRDETGGTPVEGFVNEYVNVFGSVSSDTIDGSFEGASGVVGVNQAAGSLNNQNNAIAIAVGTNAVYALGEADLGQYNTANLADVTDQTRTDAISGSFGNFAGIAAVNQAAGTLNNQANVVDVAVSLGATLPFTPTAP